MKIEVIREQVEVDESVTHVGGRYQERQGLWEIIKDFPIPFGTEYLRYKHKWRGDFALGCIKEYKRFAFLALAGDSDITPSVAVDEVWHLHILHTTSYADFAERCGKFLHHNPGMPTQVVKWDTQYDITFERYHEAFGQDAPEPYWPRGTWRSGSIGDVLRELKKQTTTLTREAA